MNSYHWRSLVAALLLFTFAPRGAPVKCYSCKSEPSGACGDPFNSTLFAPQKCEDNEHLCLKQKQILHNADKVVTEVTRGCAPQGYCRLMVFEECSVCDTDSCNSSCTSIPSVMILITQFLWLILSIR